MLKILTQDKYDAMHDVRRCTDHFLIRLLFVSNDIQTFICHSRYKLLKKNHNYEISDVCHIKNNFAL